MNDIILEKLGKLEKDNNITILYAVESGSRAWGHHNPDSDYDIRFIYKNNNINEYLTINNKKDVIESNDGLYDIVGWDIKKALLLHYKSNPNLREWILSPIKYIEDKNHIFNNLPDFDKVVLKHHYHGLTKRHYKKYLKNKEKYDIKYLKKLLYTIRCTLIWKILDENIYPPMNMDEILEKSDIKKDLKNVIFNIKKIYGELDESKINENEINIVVSWIELSLEYMENNISKQKNRRDIEVYNRRFQEIIQE